MKSGALACRRESLGNSLCEHAWRLLPGTSSKIRSEAQNIYATWMRQLQGHETKPRDCARFYQFHRLKWQPQVFFWAEGTLSWYEPLVGYLQADPLYKTTWRFAAEKLYYGPRDVNACCLALTRMHACRGLRWKIGVMQVRLVWVRWVQT